jgi:ketosteroid isomerase-like protein
MSREHDHVTIARRYVHAIESGAALDEFLGENIEYEELPNRLSPNGRRATREEMLASALKGQEVLSSQHVEIVNAIAAGDAVVLEVAWVGTLKVGFGELPVGKQLRDRSAIFLEIRNGKIVRQRNYDCYESL